MLRRLHTSRDTQTEKSQAQTYDKLKNNLVQGSVILINLGAECPKKYTLQYGTFVHRRVDCGMSQNQNLHFKSITTSKMIKGTSET